MFGLTVLELARILFGFTISQQIASPNGHSISIIPRRPLCARERTLLPLDGTSVRAISGRRHLAELPWNLRRPERVAGAQALTAIAL